MNMNYRAETSKIKEALGLAIVDQEKKITVLLALQKALASYSRKSVDAYFQKHATALGLDIWISSETSGYWKGTINVAVQGFKETRLSYDFRLYFHAISRDPEEFAKKVADQLEGAQDYADRLKTDLEHLDQAVADHDAIHALKAKFEAKKHSHVLCQFLRI
jgi:hypothetical protein